MTAFLLPLELPLPHPITTKKMGQKIVAFSWIWLPGEWTAASDGRLLGVTFVAPPLPKSIHTPCLSKLTSASPDPSLGPQLV